MAPCFRRDDEKDQLTFSVTPPSTTSSIPVTYLDSSEARNRIGDVPGSPMFGNLHGALCQ
jgi:hypothetical protein